MALTISRPGDATATRNGTDVTVSVPLQVVQDGSRVVLAESAVAVVNIGRADWQAQLLAQLRTSADAIWARGQAQAQADAYVTATLTPQVDAYLGTLEV